MINDFKIQLYSIMLTFLYISGIFISENNQNLVVWTNNIIFFRLNITLLYYLLILHYWPVVKHFTSKLTDRRQETGDTETETERDLEEPS